MKLRTKVLITIAAFASPAPFAGIIAIITLFMPELAEVCRKRLTKKEETEI